MNLSTISRRRLIRNSTLAAALGSMGVVTPAAALGGAETNPPRGATNAGLNVRDFGAAGDGRTDDTPGFTAAMKAASEAGGNRVFVPTGNYLIQGNLDVPENVTLQGVFQAPTARTQNRGSTLLAVSGAGKPDSPPFITLHQNSTLHGLTLFYPDQKKTNPPVSYPWTVRGIGDNCSLIDVLMVNPYQAVDFGTYPAGRHLIRGLYAQPLYRGVFIDQCFDVGRVEDVHLWPFWGGWEEELGRFTREKGTAFVLGRTDWEYLLNCFCIGFNVGFHFVKTKAGSANAVLTQCGSDIGPTAVRVDHVQEHAGVSFVNGQFMAGIEILESNRGPVKFTACGFWGIPTTDHHALLQGRGHTTFNGCHFNGWGRTNPEAPCLRATRGGITVIGCDFAERNKVQLEVEPEVEAAVILGNRFRGKEKILNRAAERTQAGFNVVSNQAG